MAIKEIEVKTTTSLSFSDAVRISKEINSDNSAVIFYKDGRSVDASSVVDVLVLEIEKDSKVKVIGHGNNIYNVMEKITDILIDGAGI